MEKLNNLLFVPYSVNYSIITELFHFALPPRFSLVLSFEAFSTARYGLL